MGGLSTKRCTQEMVTEYEWDVRSVRNVPGGVVTQCRAVATTAGPKE